LYCEIISQLNASSVILTQSSEGKIMKRQYSSTNRNKLRLKMANVFGENIQMLSTELQEILLDDLVTAFENRINVLNRAKSTVKLEMAESVKCETIQT
jgi:hypothetical protein